VVGGVLAITLGLVSISHAQQGMGYVPGTAFGGATDPGALKITEGFRIIPTIMVGERYDSNVFFRPRTPGLDREDFVTTTSPQLRGLYAGSLISVNAVGGATGEYYAKNTGLNYIGANASASLDMSKFLSQWWRGSTWQVTEFYINSAQPQTFLTGDVIGASVNPFVRGYQVGRTNYQNNIVSTNLSVPLNQTLALIGSYSNGFTKFGSSSVQQGTLLDSNSQSYTAGIVMKYTHLDTFSLNVIGSEFDYGSRGSFVSRGGTVGWSHEFSQILSISSSAGVQYIKSQFQGVPSRISIAPTGSFNLTWKDNTTTLGLAYFMGLTPSFQFEAQPLLTHTVSFALTQVTPIKDLVGVVGVNYARGDELRSSASAPISYTSYGATAGVTYKLTSQTFLGLNYNYRNVDNNFRGNSTAFDRSVVQLTLTQAFY
jgi:opacity protein-like surface antigen